MATTAPEMHTGADGLPTAMPGVPTSGSMTPSPVPTQPSTPGTQTTMTPGMPSPGTPGPEMPGPEMPGPELPEPEVPGPEMPEPEVPEPEVPEPEVPEPEVPEPEVPTPVDAFDCVLPELPEANALDYYNEKLPDPFTFFDGTPVTTKAQWECRRKEILAMAAKYLYGPVPGDCDEVSGSVNGGSVSISCTVGGNTENFSANISGSGSVIALNLSAGIVPGGSKSLSFGNGFEGGIRSLYGLSELNPNIANGWMINRVMDVLEANPDSGHDPTKMVVSGCSGCGKGAFLAGVFSRIPMTVIVESGGGGGTSWRMTQWYRSGNGNWVCGDLPQGIDNLDSGICGPWVTGAATPFRNNPEMVYNMPFDQHLLLATIAPRYLVHFTNDNGSNSWCHLAGTSEALAAWAAYPVFQALGVPENMAFEIYSGGHCGVGDTGIAAAMFDRAFNGNTNASTGGVTILDTRVQQPVGQWEDMWIDWDMNTVLQ